MIDEEEKLLRLTNIVPTMGNAGGNPWRNFHQNKKPGQLRGCPGFFEFAVSA
jgi:hypothetical protein